MNSLDLSLVLFALLGHLSTSIYAPEVERQPEHFSETELELEFVYMESLDYNYMCNTHSISILEKILSAPLPRNEERSVALATRYFNECAKNFDEQVRRYLSVMSLVGNITSEWLSVISDFAKEAGFSAALSIIKNTGDPRSIVNVGYRLQQMVPLQKDVKFNRNEPQTMRNRILFESFNYGEALCFHALQPPMKYMKKHIERMLNRFGNLNVVQNLISPSSQNDYRQQKMRSLSLDLNLEPMHSNVPESSTSSNRMPDFLNFYLLQEYCNRLAEVLPNMPETGSDGLVKEETLAIRRDYVQSAISRLEPWYSPNSLCLLENVYRLKWAWKVAKMLPSSSPGTVGILEELKKRSRSISRACVVFFGENMYRKTSASTSLPKYLELLNREFKSRISEHLNDNYNDAFIDNLYPRPQFARPSECPLHIKFRDNISYSPGRKLTEKQSLSRQTYLNGHGLCDFYIDVMGAYKDFGMLYDAMEFVEQLTSSSDLFEEKIDHRGTIGRFMMFFICRVFRIVIITSPNNAPQFTYNFAHLASPRVDESRKRKLQK